MSFGTIITLILLMIAIFFVVRKIMIDKKKGKSLTCGQDCSGCAQSAICKYKSGNKENQAGS